MSYGERELLFYEGDLGEALRQHAQKVQQKVDSIPQDQFLASPDDTLVQHVLPEFIIEPLTIYEDRMVMDQQETKVDVSRDFDRNPFRDRGPIHVSGIAVTISIPYTGDHGLWKLKPSTWRTTFPRASVEPPGQDGVGYVRMRASQPSDTGPERLKQFVDSTLGDIRFYLDNQRRQIDQENQTVERRVRDAIQARRTRLERHTGITRALNIPLRPREGVPPLEPLPIKRKLVRPLPPPPKGGFKPEPGIQDADYEHILSVIRHEGRTFEATPRTYSVHDEEGLRDIILAHLNGHYEGGATGETFRRKGKTDIRIEDAERAAFVAECKVWRGAKDLSAACDQLMGYLTWRDCKAALLIFNKQNAKFSELLDKVPQTLQSHPLFLKSLSNPVAGEWRCLFRSKEDEARLLTVHVFAFNLYVDA
ncbi:MAG: hypothetical protein A3H27_01150 [Acidobacteria bacterium RIFCSPLOWO2_02_FULL_59_13]|nr:MAG: hypothetical protein A3H27_01150 [Acidobacteria bacterium RIFCSPLOWO2_02_FULL_59_13]